MTKTYCDRCGAEISQSNKPHTIVFDVDYLRPSSGKRYTVCTKCSIEVGDMFPAKRPA